LGAKEVDCVSLKFRGISGRLTDGGIVFLTPVRVLVPENMFAARVAGNDEL
jgi:hypothetical protein